MHWSLTSPISGVEYAGFALVLLAAFLTPMRLRRWMGRLLAPLIAAVEARPALSLFLISLAWNFLALAILQPLPSVHDELSYWLMADTFLEGRLANPTHPMWRAFETFHVIHNPTYASKYPFLPGLLMAGSLLIFQSALIGVKLAGALATVAVWWALCGWLPRRWALLGGLIFALHFGGFSYWSQGYFGGALPSMGGALALGAYPRLARSPRLRDAVWMGVGLVIMATSRPFEGLVYAIPLTLGLILPRIRRPLALARTLAPTAIIVALGLASIAYYNDAVTGDALKFPYQTYTEQYGLAQPLRVQDPQRGLMLEHSVMRRFLDGFENELYVTSFSEHWRPVVRFHALPLMWPLLLIPLLLRQRRCRFVVLLGAIGLFTSSMTTFILPHYTAPFSALLLLLLMQCLRLMGAFRRTSRWSGRWLVGVTVTGWLYAWITMSVLTASAQIHLSNIGPWTERRAAIAATLEAEGGRHLVFVRYAKTHSPHQEWVYNGANLDDSPVLWARELNPREDAAVRRYFCGRHIWRVEPDVPGPVQPTKLSDPVCAGD